MTAVSPDRELRTPAKPTCSCTSLRVSIATDTVETIYLRNYAGAEFHHEASGSLVGWKQTPLPLALCFFGCT